jgi:hypothetical protein
MYEPQSFVWRKWKLATRLGVVLALCVAGLLIMLPKADANSPRATADAGRVSALFSPEPVSSRHFATLYPVTHS